MKGPSECLSTASPIPVCRNVPGSKSKLLEQPTLSFRPESHSSLSEGVCTSCAGASKGGRQRSMFRGGEIER